MRRVWTLLIFALATAIHAGPYLQIVRLRVLCYGGAVLRVQRGRRSAHGIDFQVRYLRHFKTHSSSTTIRLYPTLLNALAWLYFCSLLPHDPKPESDRHPDRPEHDPAKPGQNKACLVPGLTVSDGCRRTSPSYRAPEMVEMFLVKAIAEKPDIWVGTLVVLLLLVLSVYFARLRSLAPPTNTTGRACRRSAVSSSPAHTPVTHSSTPATSPLSTRGHDAGLHSCYICGVVHHGHMHAPFMPSHCGLSACLFYWK